MVLRSLSVGALLLSLGPIAAYAISTDSPFIPPGGAPALSTAAATSPVGVEFCGVMQSGGVTWFGLYEVATGKGRWLTLNRADEGWSVRSFDAGRQEIAVEIAGQTQVLALRQPRLEGGAGAAPAMANLPAGVVAPVASPTAADEAARLKAVADEIKRRRANRAAAMNGQPGNTGAPLLPPGPGPQFVPPPPPPAGSNP